MTDKPHPLAAALCQVLRELEGIPPSEEVDIAKMTPHLNAAALRFVAAIADPARLLRRGIDMGAPLDASSVLDICNAIANAANHLSGAFSMWLLVLGKDLTAVPQYVLLEAIEAIAEHAETLAHIARQADHPETRLSSDSSVALIRAVLLLVEHLHQKLIDDTPATTMPTPTEELP
jgi:hypothetical protein|nr:J286 [uncultured bacterium]